MQLLFCKWFESTEADAIQAYHSKKSAFESDLEAHRKKRNEAVSTTARVALPFCVETHIHDMFNLAWRETTVRIFDIDL